MIHSKLRGLSLQLLACNSNYVVVKFRQSKISRLYVTDRSYLPEGSAIVFVSLYKCTCVQVWVIRGTVGKGNHFKKWLVLHSGQQAHIPCSLSTHQYRSIHMWKNRTNKTHDHCLIVFRPWDTMFKLFSCLLVTWQDKKTRKNKYEQNKIWTDTKHNDNYHFFSFDHRTYTGQIYSTEELLFFLNYNRQTT